MERTRSPRGEHHGLQLPIGPSPGCPTGMPPDEVTPDDWLTPMAAPSLTWTWAAPGAPPTRTRTRAAP